MLEVEQKINGGGMDTTSPGYYMTAVAARTVIYVAAPVVWGNKENKDGFHGKRDVHVQYTHILPDSCRENGISVLPVCVSLYSGMCLAVCVYRLY